MTRGRIILSATPAAVTGYNDSYADLLNSQSGNYQYLSDSSGLVTTTDYYSSTTAGESTAGGVIGDVQDQKIRQGELGTAVTLNSTQYFLHTANSISVAPVATYTAYRNTDGTGGETTSYSYTWLTGTTQMQSEQVSSPVISSAQNGPGTADVVTTYFDSLARPVWSKDGDGFLAYAAYDQPTSAVVKTIADVNTNDTGDFSNLPSGWTTPSGGGLELITQMQVDGLGRTTKSTDPNGNITYTVYNDTSHEELVYPGWNSSTNMPTGPTQVMRDDYPGSYQEALTMSTTPHLTGGVPDGTEAISNLQTLSRAYTNAAGQVVRQDSYFNLSGVTYSTSANIGTLNTNYYEQSQGYDSRGWLTRQVTPTGTIARMVHDSLGRTISIWVGTNDTPGSGSWSPTNNTSPANMVEIVSDQYDGGGVGDGNLTQVTQYPGGSQANRVANNYFDWRDRQVAGKQGVQASENDGTHRPIVYNTFDNLNEITEVQKYDGDGVTITSTNGVPNAPSSSLLRAQSASNFDDQGRFYQSIVYDVNQSTGAASSTGLTTNSYYNHRGQVIEVSQPGGLVQKDQFDGAGRQTEAYITDGAGGTTWTAAGSATSDNVLSQTDTTYDSDGNVIFTTDRERFDNETTTGALGNATTAPKARVSYVANYFDAAKRPTATVNVGTNGGTAYTRPSTAPSSSATVLVTTDSYNAAGWLQDVVDPRGIDGRTSYDNLGRKTQTIEDYTNGTPTSNSNKTTNFTYDGSNHMLTLQAVETGGASETTQWVYGVTTGGGSNLNSNDILSTVKYPDPSTGSPSSTYQESYTVDALGENLTFTDRAGNVHSYNFDILGRQTADAITTLATGFDNSILRIQTAYNALGNAYTITSYNAASGGSIVNQVEDIYNGLDQLIQEYQAHAGAVNTSTTPNLQYAFNELAGGANNSRLVSMTYPNGRVLNYNYSTGLNSNISRLSSISDSSAALESYKYLGLDTVVERDHPQTNVNLTYISQTGGTGDAGDKYVGLDRFGRVVDQNWYNTSTSSSTDEFQYGYDQDSNVLYKNNLVDSVFSELYHASGAGNGYDNLNQLTGFARGTLSASQQGGQLDTVSSPSTTEGWSLDAMGNFSSVTLNGTPTSRTHNQQNEVTAVGSNSLTFDKNGNTTTDDQGHTLVFDAWNRLVAAKNGSTTLEAYSYDGLGRRITKNPGTLRDIYFSFAWQVVEEDVSGTMQDQYVWSPVYTDAMVERDTPTQRLYVQQDADWNSTALVNASGNVVERYVYDPYGSVSYLTVSWASLGSSAYAWIYLHQGGRLDTATGIYDFRHRDYSPTLGRWLENDPLGFGARDHNLYRAEGDAPIDSVDSSGLAAAMMQAPPPPAPGAVAGPIPSSWAYTNPTIQVLWGIGDGFAMFGNAFTFNQIPSLNTYVNGQIEQGGKLYTYANISMGVGAFATQQILIGGAAEFVGGGAAAAGEAGGAGAGGTITTVGEAASAGGILSGSAGEPAPQPVGMPIEVASPSGPGFQTSFGPGEPALPGPTETPGLPASTPVGHSGYPFGSVAGNRPTTIGNRPFSGHAFDQMQARGIPPSAVENAIQNGNQFPGNTPGTTGFHDPINNVTVITNSTTGNVITVRPGPP